jgi:hypothetical protein
MALCFQRHSRFVRSILKLPGSFFVFPKQHFVSACRNRQRSLQFRVRSRRLCSKRRQERARAIHNSLFAIHCSSSLPFRGLNPESRLLNPTRYHSSLSCSACQETESPFWCARNRRPTHWLPACRIGHRGSHVGGIRVADASIERPFHLSLVTIRCS